MHLIVGDIHGHYKAFRKILDKSNFRPGKDNLWLTGDLVNRGPNSADVIRYVMDLGSRAKTVLGNHDLHLLSVASGAGEIKPKDNSHLILDEADAPTLIEWLNSRPLALFSNKNNFLLVHAGVHKSWSVSDTLIYAGEVEAMLTGCERKLFLKNMYGSEPANWNDNLEKWERLRVITNFLTRARFCKIDGTLDFIHKGPPDSQPKNLYPWLELSERRSSDKLIFFGHWSALGFLQSNNTVCLDSGYLWGGKLTAARLKNNKLEIIQVDHE